MTTPPWLAILGIPPGCVSSDGSAREGGKRFSVRLRSGEHIWRVKVDGCWLTDQDQKRVDYLFCGQTKSGKIVVVLVELKGQDYGAALKQIERTLEWLCKRSKGQTLHSRVLPNGPVHSVPEDGGVRSYVVQGSGKKVSQHFSQRELIRSQYHVIVKNQENRLSFDSVEELASG